MTSLLDFYQQHGISPVNQDVTDLPAHFARRAGLYRSLGLPPFAFRGRTVLDVGPGAGENALYTASLQPARYVLLEPNPTAANALRERWPLTRSGRERYDVVEQRIEDYDPSRPFDVVVCEGLLGLCGTDPRVLLEHVAKHVAPGGVLVVTCIDAISQCAEIWRRSLVVKMLDRTLRPNEQAIALQHIFGPQLATLAGMTRSVQDWIVDNVLNPASIGPLFSIPDACEALEGRFDVLGCSPRLLLDGQWYKSATPGNQWAIDAYWKQAHNLLDCRRTLPQSSEALNRTLMATCVAYRDAVRAYEHGGPMPVFPHALPDRDSWFGRGQQYLSFVRR